MILGLSHIGLTVNDLGLSLKFYMGRLGLQVLSDAERKGELIDKATGIRGFHSRTVYVSVATCRHLEIFQFFNPQTISCVQETDLQIGFLYADLMLNSQKGLVSFEDDRPAWSELLGDKDKEPYPGHRMKMVQDPDGLFLRLAEGRGGEEKIGVSSQNMLCPAFLVEDIDRSLAFYRDVLGLEVAHLQDQTSTARTGVDQDDSTKQVRWALLSAPTGPCLKLIQPMNVKILPPIPWQMQRVGFTHLCFGVEDLDICYRRLTKKGVNFKSPPQSVISGPHQGGKFVYLITDEGTRLEFVESPLILEEVSSLTNNREVI